MPDCKSPYLTASRLMSEYGRKIINYKNIHCLPTHMKTPQNLIKTMKAITTKEKNPDFKRSF